MGRNREEFAKLHPRFVLTDPRYISLSSDSKAIYITLWVKAFYDRTEYLLVDDDMIHWVETIATGKIGSFESCVKSCNGHRPLLQRIGNYLKVCGVKKIHRPVRFKATVLQQPDAVYDSQEEEVEVEQEVEVELNTARHVKQAAPKVPKDLDVILAEFTEQTKDMSLDEFPDVDFKEELRKMRVWINANSATQKVKRKKNWQRFAMNWLSKAQGTANYRKQAQPKNLTIYREKPGKYANRRPDVIEP